MRSFPCTLICAVVLLASCGVLTWVTVEDLNVASRLLDVLGAVLTLSFLGTAGSLVVESAAVVAAGRRGVTPPGYN